MSISFSPLWNCLKEKGLKKNDLRISVGLSNATVARLGKDQSVSLDSIHRICLFLNCRIEEVICICDGSNEEE